MKAKAFYDDGSCEIFSPNLKQAMGGVWFLFHHKKSKDVILIDCGIGFNEEITFDTEHNLVDSRAEIYINFINKFTKNYSQNNQKLPILVTHPHQDHSRGVIPVSQIVEIELYLSNCSRRVIDRAFWSNKLNIDFPIHEFKPEKGKIKIGVFEIEYFEVSHSVDESYSFIVKYPDENGQMKKILFLTEMRIADLPFKIGTTEKALKIIRRNSPYDLVIYDGLLRKQFGYTMGEETMREIVNKIFNDPRIKGDAIFPIISSKMGLTYIILDEANKNNWAFLSYGSTMKFMFDMGMQKGRFPEKVFPEGLDYQIAKVVTGSQAEKLSVMKMVEELKETLLKVKENDWIVMIQGVIPGRLGKVRKMLNKIAKMCPKGGILLTRGQQESLRLEGENIYTIEDFFKIKENIQLPSGHERRDGQDFILSHTHTPSNLMVAYQSKYRDPAQYQVPEKSTERRVKSELKSIDKIIIKVLKELKKDLNIE